MFRRLTVPSLVYDDLRLDVIEKVLSIQRELLARNKAKSIRSAFVWMTVRIAKISGAQLPLPNWCAMASELRVI